jgi:SAM-dependent methyltransferase
MNETTLTYINPKGAQAYWEKEKKTAEERNKSAWAILDKIPLKGRTALDIGCAFGRDVAEMRRRGAEAYGVDVSPNLLARATKDYGPWFAERDLFKTEALPFGLIFYGHALCLCMFLQANLSKYC